MATYPSDLQDSPLPPYQKLAAVPFARVTLGEGLWRQRVDICRRMALKANLEQCEKTGRLANFRRAAGLEAGGFQGLYFNDSDVYKMIEGVAYCLALKRDAAVEARIDALIEAMARAQQPDGYLNTYYTLSEPTQRWTNLKDKHELYCAGHLMEAAVAYTQATGKTALLDVACRCADHIDATFGPPATGKHQGCPGHEEIELALVKLARATGQQRYLKLAQYFLDERGTSSARGGPWGPYWQDHQPVRRQRQAVGHAVRAMYLYSAMTDLAAHTGEPALGRAVQALWRDVTTHHLYVTGGIGARHQGEAFGDPYELPNESAYCETCASVGLVLWAQRLTLLHADARYADVLERTLYNSLLAGMAQNGQRFFYVNPLASHGHHNRAPWFACACCPPNVLRWIPTIGGYAYATAPGRLYLNHFLPASATIDLGNGPLRIDQKTNYPWDGRIHLMLTPQQPQRLALHLRIPGWCDRPRLALNGRSVPLGALPRGYAVLRRLWRPGDGVELDLPMPPRRLYADPRIAADVGRVALARGPLVYCAESTDNQGHALDLVLPPASRLSARHRPDHLGSVTVLQARAATVRAAWRHPGLYTCDHAPPLTTRPLKLMAVPYFAWNNRGPGRMTVWLGETPQVCEPAIRPL